MNTLMTLLFGIFIAFIMTQVVDVATSICIGIIVFLLITILRVLFGDHNSTFMDI